MTPGLRIPSALWLAGGVLWFVLEGVAAAGYPGYDYAGQYISDLGAVSLAMSAGFWLEGILFLVAAILVVRAIGGRMRWLFLVIAVAYACGWFLVAAFPSSMQTYEAGDIGWHTLGANLVIVGGNVLLIVGGVGAGAVGASRAFRITAVALGVIGLAAAVLMALSGVTPGLWERGAIYPVLIAQILVGALTLFRRR